MTPYGVSVAQELRTAMVPVEVASIVDHLSLPATIRALVGNALFWVVPTPAIESAGDRTIAASETLAATIGEIGVHLQGVSLDVDRARAEALDAFEALIETVADAEPTQSAKSLGVA